MVVCSGRSALSSAASSAPAVNLLSCLSCQVKCKMQTKVAEKKPYNKSNVNFSSYMYYSSVILSFVGVTAKITLMFLAVTDMICLITNFFCNVIPYDTKPNWFIVSIKLM